MIDPQTTSGGFVRLNPADGLFLQARHLTTIQDYARDLMAALGVSIGPGVVHGFGVSLHADELRVTPGLAVAPDGRPLRSSDMITVPLAGVTLHGDEYRIVEIGSQDRPFGEEPIYGALCDDPCAGGSTFPTQVSEGVAVVLEPAQEPGLRGRAPEDRREWLASRYFARERSGSWLRPSPTEQRIALDEWPWAEPTGAPQGDRVPLGVLQRVEDRWVLDAWTTRRDRGDPPPRRAWQHRLGMRPWDVFLAQILQFQVQLAEQRRTTPPSYGAARLSGDDLYERIEAIRADLAAHRRGIPRGPISELVALAAQVDPSDAPLPELGIHELPPAGFLPVRGDDDDDVLVGRLLPGLDLRFRSCRADEVAREVEAVQHGDRIRFEPPGERVDVLVPDAEDDVRYPWVAFVRGHGRVGLQERDEVRLALVVSDPAQHEARVSAVVESGEADEDWQPRRATVTYPARTWAVPPESDVYGWLHDALSRSDQTTVVTSVTALDRRPLGAVRTTLLVGLFSESDRGFTPRILVRPGSPESVVVLVRRQQLPDE